MKTPLGIIKFKPHDIRRVRPNDINSCGDTFVVSWQEGKKYLSQTRTRETLEKEGLIEKKKPPLL